MKLLYIIGHPLTMVIVFSMVVISGEATGGLYAMYILLGIPFGVLHAWIALAAIISMLLGYYNFRSRMMLLKPLLYLFSCGMMLLALLLFFENSKGYNDATFRQTVPLISFVVFGICMISCVLYSLRILFLQLRKPGAGIPTI